MHTDELFSCLAGEAQSLKPLQVVIPRGVESVNGSDTNMGCASSLVQREDMSLCTSPSSSYLFDTVSPSIDTSASTWASELVTVKPDITDAIPFSHVLFSFGFDRAVSVAAIELDMFLCPQWSINAPLILVYTEQITSLKFNSFSDTNDIVFNHSPDQSSCDSLSTVHLLLPEPTPAITWHVIVATIAEETEWVHVGEIRFKSNITVTPTSFGIILSIPQHCIYTATQLYVFAIR